MVAQQVEENEVAKTLKGEIPLWARQLGTIHYVLNYQIICTTGATCSSLIPAGSNAGFVALHPRCFGLWLRCICLWR
jgi:hypothetical protein